MFDPDLFAHVGEIALILVLSAIYFGPFVIPYAKLNLKRQRR